MKDSDLFTRRDAEIALLNKGQASKRYRLGEKWELNFDEIREAFTDFQPDASKPPIGVKPYYVAAWQRIGELIDAIERQYESHDGDAKLVEKWANEIQWQCSLIESLRDS